MTSNGRRPADVAEELGVPPSTLRRWSQQFADVLSPPRTMERGGQRRYLDSDVEVLAEVKRLLALGFTYREIRQQLMEDRGIVDASAEAVPASAGDDPEDIEAQPTFGAVVEPQSSLLPADEGDQLSIGQLLATTLDSLSDSQQIILSNQQTARQLLGVLLQDNFNLKEENRRLREQMVETERRIYELKRELDAEQQQDQQRMRQLEANLFEMQRRLDSLTAGQTARRAPAAPATPPPAPAAPPPVAPQSTAPAPTQAAPPAQKKGFWDWLFGR